MKKILIATTIFLLLAIPGTVLAKPLAVDPAHTEIRFGIQHIFVMTTGRFTDFKADIFFDADSLSESRFDFTVEVKSIHTFNNKRDKHLLSKDFFDAASYPQMRFKSQKVTHIKDNIYELEGMITIKDVTRPLKIKFYNHGPVENPFDKKKTVAGFNASFEIDRLDFNVGDGRFFKMGVVGKTVTVNIEMEAIGK